MALIILILGAGAWALWWGAHRHVAASSAAAPILVISGDTAGWITPCGCTANQSGGLLRRGTFLRQLRSENSNVIYADVGGAPAGDSPYQRAKFEAVILGEQEMGLAAHNIGGPEARLGPAYLRDLATRLKTPLVSANAKDSDGHLIAPAARMVNVQGRRVALIGVLSQSFATSEVHIDEPRPAIISTLAAMKGTYNSAVVLAYVSERELAQLAIDVPEADAIIGGHTGQAISPKEAGPVLVAAATNKGKFLIQLDVPPKDSSQRWKGKVAEMDPSLADDPTQLANLRQYLQTIGEKDFSAEQSGLVGPLLPNAPADYRVAGSESCAACHRDEERSWNQSKHAHAWDELKPRGFQVDPYCLQCHTTGYGMPGGFDSLRRTPSLVHVGCESCHGPSQAHARDPKMRTTFAAENQCVRCHDAENSPTFDYAAQWEKIRHGRVNDSRVGSTKQQEQS
ncbi:MAG TPA: multiheme c-type cytochrome [Humisphaera sp.]|nr:multiheme c-type cytochrome [Humisphaera sp.]